MILTDGVLKIIVIYQETSNAAAQCEELQVLLNGGVTAYEDGGDAFLPNFDIMGDAVGSVMTSLNQGSRKKNI